MNCTHYHTKEGLLVYKAQSRWAMYSARRAVKKAKALGYTTLIATEADGRQIDYINFFGNKNGAT